MHHPNHRILHQGIANVLQCYDKKTMLSSWQKHWHAFSFLSRYYVMRMLAWRRFFSFNLETKTAFISFGYKTETQIITIFEFYTGTEYWVGNSKAHCPHIFWPLTKNFKTSLANDVWCPSLVLITQFLIKHE